MSVSSKSEKDAEASPTDSYTHDSRLPNNAGAAAESGADADPAAEKAPYEITYPEGGLSAWIVVLGSWCAMTAGFGVVNTIGVFEAYISTHQLSTYSSSATGWIFGINIFLVFFCGVQIGPIFDAKGPRMLLGLGGVCLLVGLFTIGLCTEFWQFILAFSLLSGLGSSLLFTPSVAAVAHWFDVRRGTATGIACTGGSVGGIIFPLMLQALLPKVGWAWATRVLGFVCLVLCAAGVLLCRSRLPPKKGAQTQWRDMLPDPRIFWDGTGALAVTTAGIFFVEWGYFIPVTYVTSYYLTRQGLRAAGSVNGDAAFAYQLIAILNAASCFGRYLPGYIADRVGRYNTMILSIVLCIVAVFGFWLPDALAPETPSVGVIIFFAILFGFASGSNISLTPICVGQLCDTQEYGRYYASAYTIVSFGSLTGIPIAGALIQATGVGGRQGYWGLIVFTGAAYVAALACFVWVRVRIKGWKVTTIW